MTSHDLPSRPIAVITGGNRGLGYETARRLAAAGYTVIIGSRSPSAGEAAARLLGSEHVSLDVGDAASVRAAAEQIAARHGRVDVLVNNAGITGPTGPLETIGSADAAGVFDVNVLGIVRTTHAFVPLLRKSANPRIVNVTSGLGSFGRIHDAQAFESHAPPMIYHATKAAVCMLTVQYARALPGMRVNAADPGYTATDMTGGPDGGGHSVHDGTDAIFTLATLDPEGRTGTFIDRDGPVPW